MMYSFIYATCRDLHACKWCTSTCTSTSTGCHLQYHCYHSPPPPPPAPTAVSLEIGVLSSGHSLVLPRTSGYLNNCCSTFYSVYYNYKYSSYRGMWYVIFSVHKLVTDDIIIHVISTNPPGYDVAVHFALMIIDVHGKRVMKRRVALST